MKAALYLRVSTLEQAKEGYSLDAQLEKTKKYADYQGYEIFKVYRDDGYSGKDIHRPRMEEMLNDIAAGLIDIVIIYKLDRLTRRVKDVLELVEIFGKYNVSLYSLSENIDLSSPFGRAALKMAVTFSELERETIIDRMMLGKDQRVKQGKRLPVSKNAFGWRYNKASKHFDIVPEEAELINRAADLYLTEDYSIRKLYDYSNTHFENFHTNNIMFWKNVLMRPLNAGYISYKGELYKGVNFEPIMSMEKHLQLVEKCRQNTSRRSSDNSPYLLTGLVKCAHCGSAYVGKRYDRNYIQKNGQKTTKYIYQAYGCAGRVKRDKRRNVESCDNEIIPADILDSFVIDKVNNLNISGLKESSCNIGMIESLLGKNQELKGKQNRLVDLYMEELIDKTEYKRRVYEIESEIHRNETVIENEKGKMNASPVYSLDYIRSLHKDFATASKLQQRKFLKIIIREILVDDDNINIIWNVNIE